MERAQAEALKGIWCAYLDELKQAADEYVDWYIAPGASRWVGWNQHFIKRYLVENRQPLLEEREFSVGPMYLAHSRLNITPEARKQLDLQWEQFVARSRLLQTGLGAVAVFGLLFVALGYFKLDTATRGFYTGRLQFITVAAILSLVVAGVLFARWIPWL